MKAADLKNLFNEYGMSPGPSTPVSQQQSGANAKRQQSATASSASPSAVPSSSPSTAPSASPQTQDSDQVDQQPQALVVKADQLEKDAVFPSEKGDPVKVISPANSFDPNVPDDAEDSVIVHDERTDQYYALDPDADIAIPQVEETVFDRFDQLSLVEQLAVMSQLNSDIINEAWGKKKTLENSKPHFLKPGELSGSWSDAQLKSLGFRKASNDSWFISQAKWNKLSQMGERRWRSLIPESAGVQEGVPNNDSEYLLRKIMSQPLLTGDIRAQMNAYIALPDPDMLLQFRLMRAEGGDCVDLRSVVKQYMEKLHPKIKKQFDV